MDSLHAQCMHLGAATCVLRLTDTRIMLCSLYLTRTARDTRYAISWEAKDKLNAEVSKGALRILGATGPAGHEFRILNETHQPVKDATLWLAGNEYKVGEDDLIVVPFSNRPGRQTVVLRSGGFSALGNFFHQGEAYALDAGLYVDREALVKGAQAKLVVRPVLRLNGHPISLKVLQDLKLVILSTGRDGVPTMLEVPVGEVKFVFHEPHLGNFREEMLGEIRYLRLTVPPRVWFGFQGCSSSPSLLLNISDIPHDPEEVDTKNLNEFPFQWNQTNNSY